MLLSGFAAGAVVSGILPSAPHSQQLLGELAKIQPQFHMYGTTNTWVVKPAAKSRGRGIFCENRLDYILAKCDRELFAHHGGCSSPSSPPLSTSLPSPPFTLPLPSTARYADPTEKWVAQKYLETPYLVHNTKVE